MTTLWFSYSLPLPLTLDSEEPNRSPYHHAWHTGRMLRDKAHERGWDFRYVNLDSTEPVSIGSDDICIYHAWFDEGCFSQQVTRQTCKAKFILQPYTSRMVGKEAEASLREQWQAADWLFLNTGCYWWDTMQDTEYGQYKAKATRLDNMVNPALHPHSKKKWNKQGERAALCIGYDNPIKGLDAVAELAQVTGIKLFHTGSVSDNFFQHVPRISSVAGMDFTPPNIRWLCDNVDVFLTMGRYDANPTTLIETACWGLLSCCTKESGYHANDPFIELRHGDMAHNMDILDWIQRAPVVELEKNANRIRDNVIATHAIERRNQLIWDKMLELMS